MKCQKWYSIFDQLVYNDFKHYQYQKMIFTNIFSVFIIIINIVINIFT